MNIPFSFFYVKDAELELCKDDNEQLMTQYEREKHLRKSAEQVKSRRIMQNYIFSQNLFDCSHHFREKFLMGQLQFRSTS